jgi:hypothetical protein
VEGPLARVDIPGGPIRTATDDPVVEAHEYYLMDSDGTVRAVYEWSAGSIDDDSYGRVHKVVGTVLYEYFTTYHFSRHGSAPDGGFRRDNVQHPLIDGLAEVRLGEALGRPAEAAERSVGPALDAFRSREREAAAGRLRPIADVRDSFEAALARLPAEAPVDLVFGYDGGAVVRRPDGEVVWRPATGWPYRGKDLFHLVRETLERRCGARRCSFELDIDDAPWWFWAPDD